LLGILPYANVTPQGIYCAIPDSEGFHEGLGLKRIANWIGLSDHCTWAGYVLCAKLGLVELLPVQEAIQRVGEKVEFRACRGIILIKQKLFDLCK
jgi:hypothetical protein